MGTRVLEETSKNRKHKSGRSNTDVTAGDYLPRPSQSSRFEGGDYRDEETTRQSEQQEQWKRFAGFGIGIASIFAENVISHPCVVLRRQCQVNHLGEWHHLTPFSLFQVAFNLTSSQGGVTFWKGIGSTLAVRGTVMVAETAISEGGVTFWKGIGSTLAVRGTVMVAETAISEVTTFPKEITRHAPLKKFGQHILLKSLATAIVTPFYATSLPETVQSDIASERPGMFDCYTEGMARLMGWGVPHTTRLIPIWHLILPTVTHRVCHYLISSVAQYTVTSAMRLERQQYRSAESEDPDPPDKSLYDTYFPDLLATFTGSLLADMMLYPLETVLHRLYIQGTRTIIDNVDSGFGVVPINTRYDGVLDCVRTIVSEEGVTGLYRGFGALALQYCLHAAILKVAKLLFERFSEDTRSERRTR